jgi:Mg/Co/Ni transporter MgtE
MNEHVSESAGRLATLAVPRTAKDRTVASVLAEVQSFSDEYETVDYIYVLEDERLVGVISIHELLA